VVPHCWVDVELELLLHRNASICFGKCRRPTGFFVFPVLAQQVGAGPLPLDLRFDLSLAWLRMWLATHDPVNEHGSEAAFVGVIMRPHRLFAAGDVVFSHWANGGGERAPFLGKSTKLGRFIGPMFLQFARHRNRETFFNNSLVHIFARPDELSSKSWSHPELRELALSALRAACSAPPVSTTSGGTPSKGPDE